VCDPIPSFAVKAWTGDSKSIVLRKGHSFEKRNHTASNIGIVFRIEIDEGSLQGRQGTGYHSG
jgi:hypothetical protein